MQVQTEQGGFMKKNLITLIFFFAAFQLHAQVQSLSLDDALDLATKNNSELQSQKIQLEAAERKAKNSASTFIPSLGIGASDTVNFPSQENINSFSVEASANLSLKADCFSNISKAKTDSEAELLNYEIALFNINQSVSDSYFEIAGLDYEIAIKTESVKNLFELYNDNKSKYQKGFLSEVDYLSSKILYEKSKSELNALTLDYKQQLLSFNLILGISLETEIKLKSDLPELFSLYKSSYEDYTSAIQSLLTEKKFPAVQLLEKQLLSAKQNLKAKKIGTFGPEFNLSYNGGPTWNSPAAEDQQLFNNSMTARISVPLDSLFSKSQSREEIRECEDEINNLSIQLEAAKLSNCLELQNLVQQLEKQSQTLETYSELIEITKRNLELCQNSYSRGLMDFQSLKNISSEYLDIQNEYSAKVVEILKLYSSIENKIGKKIR